MSYSFSISVKDFATSSLMKVGAVLSVIDNRANRTQTNLQNSFDRPVNSIDSLRGKLDLLNQQRTASTSTKDIKFLTNNIRETERELRRLENLPPMSFRERLRGVAGQFGGLIGLAGGFGIAMQAFNGIKSIVQKGVELEQANVKFEVLLGSAERAKSLLGELNQYANFTPYDNASIQKGAETMLGFGIAQEKIMPSMKMLGDVAMGNKEKLSGLSLVYSQIMATGRLMGQDLLQLINQGFNPLQIISEQTGIGMGKLKEKMEQGAISAEMVEEAFRLATSEGGRYYQMADKMAKTAGGKWSTMMGTLQSSIAIIGKELATWLSPMLDIGIAFAENILPFAKWIYNLIEWVNQCTPLLIALGSLLLAATVKLVALYGAIAVKTAVLGIYKLVMIGVNGVLAAFNFLLSANPIGIVILAIGALIAIAAVLWNKFDGLRGGVMGVLEVLKGLGEMIKNIVINRFKELLSGIGGIGNALLALVNGDFSKAFDYAKGAMRDLTGAGTAKQAFEDGKKAFQNFSAGYEKGVAMKGTGSSLRQIIEIGKPKQEKTTMFDDLLGDTGDKKSAEKGAKNNKAKSTSENIISGGRKQTNINITINKLQDKVEIHVSNTQKGIDRLGEKIQEELLRAVNSINQLQTS